MLFSWDAIVSDNQEDMATEMPFTCQYQLPSVLLTLKVEQSEWVWRHSQIQCCCCPVFGYSHTFIFHVQSFLLLACQAHTFERSNTFSCTAALFLSWFEEDNHRCSYFKWCLKIRKILNIALKQVKLKFFLWTGMEHY